MTYDDLGLDHALALRKQLIKLSELRSNETKSLVTSCACTITTCTCTLLYLAAPYREVGWQHGHDAPEADVHKELHACRWSCREGGVAGRL